MWYVHSKGDESFEKRELIIEKGNGENEVEEH